MREDTVADPGVKGHLSILKPDQIVSIWPLESLTEEVVARARIDKVLNSVHVVVADQVIRIRSTNNPVALIEDHAANIGAKLYVLWVGAIVNLDLGDGLQIERGQVLVVALRIIQPVSRADHPRFVSTEIVEAESDAVL